MIEVAAAAGVGRSTLYRHFSSRQALEAALQERGDARHASAPAPSDEVEPVAADLVAKSNQSRVAFTQGLQVVALVSAVLAALTAVGVALFLRQVKATSPGPGGGAAAAVTAAEPE